MIVALYGKRIYFWLLSLSKVKAGIFYFLMTAIPVILIYIAVGVVFYRSYWGAFTHADFLLMLLAMDAVFGSIFFREKAFEKLKKEQELSSKGLTPADITNIGFVKYWENKRGAGQLKYVIINGLFAGCILFLPVSFLLYPYAEPTVNPFSELSDMLGFILKCFIVGLATGFAFNVISWHLNERRFKKLTQFI